MTESDFTLAHDFDIVVDNTEVKLMLFVSSYGEIKIATPYLWRIQHMQTFVLGPTDDTWNNLLLDLDHRVLIHFQHKLPTDDIRCNVGITDLNITNKDFPYIFIPAWKIRIIQALKAKRLQEYSKEYS